MFTRSIYTLEDLKARKGLDANNQLKSGWISEVVVLVKNGYHVVAKVDLKYINDTHSHWSSK